MTRPAPMMVGGVVLTRGGWLTIMTHDAGSLRTSRLREVSVSTPSAVPPPSESVLIEPTGFWGRPGPAQRAENRERMMTETAEAFAKYGSAAATLLIGHPVAKLYAGLVLLGWEDPLWEGQ